MRSQASESDNLAAPSSETLARREMAVALAHTRMRRTQHVNGPIEQKTMHGNTLWEQDTHHKDSKGIVRVTETHVYGDKDKKDHRGGFIKVHSKHHGAGRDSAMILPGMRDHSFLTAQNLVKEEEERDEYDAKMKPTT